MIAIEFENANDINIPDNATVKISAHYKRGPWWGDEFWWGYNEVNNKLSELNINSTNDIWVILKPFACEPYNLADREKILYMLYEIVKDFNVKYISIGNEMDVLGGCESGPYGNHYGGGGNNYDIGLNYGKVVRYIYNRWDVTKSKGIKPKIIAGELQSWENTNFIDGFLDGVNNRFDWFGMHAHMDFETQYSFFHGYNQWKELIPNKPFVLSEFSPVKDCDEPGLCYCDDPAYQVYQVEIWNDFISYLNQGKFMGGSWYSINNGWKASDMAWKINGNWHYNDVWYEFVEAVTGG